MTMELIYFHDPMCSWCWAFRPVWTDMCRQLPPGLRVRRVVGGLAPDSEVPMPAEMRLKLQSIWHSIQAQVPGTAFNFAFWEHCTPRRSTYNACRAVIAAGRLSPELEEPMIHAIQKAYYLEARNPSDTTTLVQLAGVLGMDEATFEEELLGAAVEHQLQSEISMAREAPIQGFPGLVVQAGEALYPIRTDYRDATPMLRQIEAVRRHTANASGLG